MEIALYSSKTYDQPFFNQAIKGTDYRLRYLTETLHEDTVDLSKGCEAVCCFVTDNLNEAVLTRLKKQGVRFIALRSAGYDHLDLKALHKLKLHAARVPSYSPNAIAEFTVALVLSLARKIPQTIDQVRAHNFALDNLLGINLEGKTVGLIGTGNIGTIFAKIMLGFGCKLLAFDPYPSDECKQLGITYVELNELLQRSDIISLHCPLNEATKHIINQDTLALMKQTVILVNTARGANIDTKAVINALLNNKIGALGIDVYEKEKGLFFGDHSREEITDNDFLELQKFPNVLITGHQAYFTEVALTNIAKITIDNIQSFEQGKAKNAL